MPSIQIKHGGKTQELPPLQQQPSLGAASTTLFYNGPKKDTYSLTKSLITLWFGRFTCIGCLKPVIFVKKYIYIYTDLKNFDQLKLIFFSNGLRPYSCSMLTFLNIALL